MTQITDQMAKAALDAFEKAIKDCCPCNRCSGRGYHHGFGDDGHDPDWCSICGGSGFAQAHTEQEAMKLALEAALTP